MTPPASQARALPRALAVFVCCVWCACVAYGFTQLARHELSPGASAASIEPSAALAALGLPAEPGRPQLVVFAHPHCPCTRASLNELAQIAARCGERLAIHIYVEELPGLDEPSERSASWKLASAIGGARVELDRGSRVARAFGARTSGQAFLIGARGALEYAGGLTRARGHEGTSAGAQAIVELVHSRAAQTRSAPVYGCALACAVGSDPETDAEVALP